MPELVADGRVQRSRRPPAIAAPGHDDAGAATAVVDPPVYRTTLPPPFAFALELKRGGIVGTGILQWQLDGTRYRARSRHATAALPLMVLDSVGGLDAAGIAPQRYLDRRRGRGSAQAANFQRDAGKVTFSGPAVEAPLPPGAQDRLSWMLQLAAIAEAEPALVGPGGRVSFLVVGARGDADLWTFVHVGPETLACPRATRRHCTWCACPSAATTRGPTCGSTLRATTCRCARGWPTPPTPTRCNSACARCWRHLEPAAPALR